MIGMPITLRSLLESVEYQDPALGVLFAGLGLIFLLIGARVFKVLMALSFACIGFGLGRSLPLDPVWAVIAGVVAGVGLAVASRFFVKTGVAVLAGGWFAAVIIAIADSLRADPTIALAAGGLAFLVAVSLVFVLYFEVIAAVMSLEGTILLFSGVLVLVSHYSGMWYRLRSMLLEMPALVVFLVVAGTVTGYYMQIAERQKKQVGTSG
jgi:hypothetical protein